MFSQKRKPIISPQEEKKLAKKYAKDNCVLCNAHIYSKEDNYILRGNYCQPCNTRITGHNLRGRMSKFGTFLAEALNLKK